MTNPLDGNGVEAATRAYLRKLDIDPDYPHGGKPDSPAWWTVEAPHIAVAITAYLASSPPAVEPVAWTNRANLRVLEQAEPLFYAVMWGENTAEWNVPLFDASALAAQAAALVAAEGRAEAAERLTAKCYDKVAEFSDRAEAAESEVAALKARVAELEAGLEPFAEAFHKADDPGVSDLYNEQPFSLHLPLGTWRRARSLIRRLGKGIV